VAIGLPMAESLGFSFQFGRMSTESSGPRDGAAAQLTRALRRNFGATWFAREVRKRPLLDRG
jgi:hypothetical protein